MFDHTDFFKSYEGENFSFQAGLFLQFFQIYLKKYIYDAHNAKCIQSFIPNTI